MRYEEEVSQFIEDETPSYMVLGSTLQYGRFTEQSLEQCSAIIFSPVDLSYFDLPDRLDVMVNIISRAESFESAREDAEVIYNVLYGRINQPLPIITSGNELKIQTSESPSPPQWIGLDENKRNMWSATYLLRLLLIS